MCIYNYTYNDMSCVCACTGVFYALTIILLNQVLYIHIYICFGCSCVQYMYSVNRFLNDSELINETTTMFFRLHEYYHGDDIYIKSSQGQIVLFQNLLDHSMYTLMTETLLCSVVPSFFILACDNT